ncbi:MAG: terminase large subunit [Paraclostridium sp.]
MKVDFGFETSYNALMSVVIDDKNKDLYIFDEYYKNKMTDDKTAEEISSYKDKLITGDSAEPKTIAYYQQQGFQMRKCKKFPGSRLANTKKVKRFRHIYCSDKCKNTIRELKNLTYAKDKQGKILFDEFNIDPHTFSAIWYALDGYEVADLKKVNQSR